MGKVYFCKNFKFGKSGFEEQNVIIKEISNERNVGEGYRSNIQRADDIEQLEKYVIRDEEDNIIATVSQDGKIHLTEEYLQKLKDNYGKHFDSLENLDDIDFELPEDNLVMTEDLSEYKQKEREGQEGARTDKKKDEKEEEREKQEENNEQDLDKLEEEKIAESKGIPPQNVLKVREDSNFYEDHPELEPNLYFYKGDDGIIRAEYLDENGNPQPSKYFEESKTSLRQETVAMGNDGNPVVKEVPYQVMQTKNLVKRDDNIKDTRINVNIDTYGYLEISEARQGENGEWESHDIEVRGRDYNSYDLNKETSIETRKANPDKHTKAYEKVEDTGLVQEGIQYDEMYLMEHADEIIEEFIDEGYNKEEAIQIFDLMIGEEALPEEEAKSKVNDKIRGKEEKQKEEDSRSKEDDEDEGRTPWGDAEERRHR